jgi:hypothetical protein
MANNKTWSMQDLDNVFPETKSEETKPEPALIEIAKASPKPAYHNSMLKAVLLLGGGACLAVIAALLFSLTGSKNPEKVVATAPEVNQPIAASNDGWETAAKQSAADAGQAINIPDSKKADTAESPSPSPSTTTAKADSKPSQSPAASAAPKPATTPTMVQVQSPKPKPATSVAAAPATNSRPVATKPSPIVIAQAPAPKPSAKPLPATVTKVPTPNNRETMASKPSQARTAEPANWEQASNMGMYGGDAAEPAAASNKEVSKQAGIQKAANNYDGPMSPTLLLAAGTNVKGHTLAPFTTGASAKQSDGVLLSVALDEPIELSQGYKLPVGTTINFVAMVSNDGSVVATSKNANIGGVEVQLPEGAIFLAAENNDLLMAKETNPGGDDLVRADINSSLWGGIAGAGKAILQGNATTTTSSGPLGTVVSQTNNGNPNIVGGVLDGAFTGMASNGQKRAQQKAEQIDKRSKLSVIDVNTRVRLFVNAPVQVQIPVSDPIAQAAELPPPQQRRLITSSNTQIADTPNQPKSPSITQTAPPPPLYPADAAKSVQSPLPQAMQKALPTNPARTHIDSLRD